MHTNALEFDFLDRNQLDPNSQVGCHFRALPVALTRAIDLT